MDKKAIQDRPLRPRIEAVSGAEPADEPNLREQTGYQRPWLDGGGLSVSFGGGVNRPSFHRGLYSEGTSIGDEAPFKEGGRQPSPKASHSISMWSSSRKAEKVPI